MRPSHGDIRATVRLALQELAIVRLRVLPDLPVGQPELPGRQLPRAPRGPAAGEDLRRQQENRESFSQERIDAFIRTHPPLLEHDASVMSEYAEMCRSRFFGSRLRSLQSTLQYADTAISRLKRIEP